MKQTFVCSCGNKISIYSDSEGEVICKKCNSVMKRKFTLSSSSDKGCTTKEVRCPIFNVQLGEDHEKNLKLRSNIHFWEVLVPEMVQSGKYSLNTMLEKGWVYFDEKGSMKIQTTPPHKR